MWSESAQCFLCFTVGILFGRYASDIGNAVIAQFPTWLLKRLEIYVSPRRQSALKFVKLRPPGVELSDAERLQL